MEYFGLLSPVLFVLFFVILLLSRFFPRSSDGPRMEQYLRGMGATLLEKKWILIASGCGEKDARVYQIVYRDRAGHLHRAQLKLAYGAFYLTNDHIIQDPAQPFPDHSRPASIPPSDPETRG